jgi:hypothetical protein
MRMSQIQKGAAFLHHRSWDDFWHNLNLKNEGFWDAMLTIEFAIPTSGKNCERTAVLGCED